MSMSQQELMAIWLSIKLAGVTTVILLLLGGPLAWWLARSNWRGKVVIEAIVALPLVLPPTVLGFYLLVMFSPDKGLAKLLSTLGIEQLIFSFSGLVLGSCIYSLPFVVQPLQNSFAAISASKLEMAATLGANKWDRIVNVVLPLSRHGIIGAAVLGFAHTLGEFGVVLMIGGNIPEETRVASIAIYDHVEALQYQQAHWLSATLLLLSFVMLLAVFASKKRAKWSSV